MNKFAIKKDGCYLAAVKDGIASFCDRISDAQLLDLVDAMDLIVELNDINAVYSLVRIKPDDVDAICDIRIQPVAA